MFTGIVEEIGQVVSLHECSLTVRAHKVLRGIEMGASIAVNGVCLTVTRFDKGSFAVDIMEETLRRTNLGGLKPGDRVNLEGALTLSKGLGGHLVQGHVDATGQIKSTSRLDQSLIITISAAPELMHYVVEKGFIAVDGISLTMIKRNESSFSVSIVGFTMKNTTLGKIEVGDTVNLEADIIAKYVERYITGKKEGISIEFLKEHGFLTG
jgi:riboflavin synthase